jgi:hypothetical protein
MNASRSPWAKSAGNCSSRIGSSCSFNHRSYGAPPSGAPALTSTSSAAGNDAEEDESSAPAGRPACTARNLTSGQILRGDVVTLAGVKEGDRVRLTYYPHTAVIARLDRLPAEEPAPASE